MIHFHLYIFIILAAFIMFLFGLNNDLSTFSIKVPGYHQWYNIKYVDDPAIYSYQLEEDLAAGNLRTCGTISQDRALIMEIIYTGA